jgi:hypothetical protein
MDHKIVEIVPAGPADSPRAHWPEKLRQEFDKNQFDGAVGNVLVSETDDVRVWHLSLPRGGWLTFHRHRARLLSRRADRRCPSLSWRDATFPPRQR